MKKKPIIKDFNKDIFDFKSPHFDAKKALEYPELVKLPNPNIESLDNLGKASLLFPFGIQPLKNLDKVLNTINNREESMQTLKNNEYKIKMKRKFQKSKECYYKILEKIKSEFMTCPPSDKNKFDIGSLVEVTDVLSGYSQFIGKISFEDQTHYMVDNIKNFNDSELLDTSTWRIISRKEHHNIRVIK
ncbi:hypothetical protein cand_011630 [Cryptosporidium andersoni]|uniref:Uncharacterized protein n=1 Tax=Cryptosporidium andersoni TaxID=117008 RepID=A0A1J4MGP8_9CRYT|nr:hypothetical protein cand_011630 [Cryptosporidium andersoni]